MDRKITIVSEKDATGALRTFTVGFGSSGSIVFNDGTFYPRYKNAESRESDEWLSIEPAAFPALAGALGDRRGESDPAALLRTLATHVVNNDRVRGNLDVRRMLEQMKVPYSVDRWLSHYDD